MNSAVRAGSFGINNAPLASASTLNAPTYGSVKSTTIASGKPLFVAKFNKSDVKYKTGLKQAVSNAVAKKPGVVFDVVAVSPANGSQLSAANAKNNATQIFQDMIEMGIGADKINLASKTSADATSSEVQIFVR